ncbi:MAG: TRAP transporter large permease subunit [Deltaproteobacteria bacterium]|nr:TRAP transporter large permease subunit [Deltaproteobacteria bacterium]
MSVFIILTISLLILFTLLAFGQYVGGALGLTALILLYFFVGKSTTLLAIIQPWETLNNFTFVALPGFILLGNIIMHSGLSMSLYRGVSPWVAWLPSKLLSTNIIACAIFSAISGSSVATAATVGAVAIPEQTKLGYDRKFVVGTLAGAGTLGLLIPPSISFIVYAALTGTSLGHLFIAGIIPGFILTIMFMAYTIFKGARNPQLIPGKAIRPTVRELLDSIKQIWPAIVLIGGIIGLIFFGIATVIEVSALGVVTAIGLAAMQRKMSWTVIINASKDCVKTTCLINFVVIGALVLQFSWANLMIPRKLAITVTQSGLPWWGVLTLIYLFYLGLGCLFDGVSMMVLTLPIIFPLVESYGWDPVWFGVLLTVLIETAQITPPVGLNLYVLGGTAGCSISEVLRGSFPFFIMLLIGVIIFTVFPESCTWLPKYMLSR